MNLLKKLNNFYVIVTALALFWVFFVDVSNIPTQISNAVEIYGINQEKKYYTEEIEKLEKEQKEMLGDQKAMEKYAREKYYMKKPTEEVFVLIDEKGEPFEK